MNGSAELFRDGDESFTPQKKKRMNRVEKKTGSGRNRTAQRKLDYLGTGRPRIRCNLVLATRRATIMGKRGSG